MPALATLLERAVNAAAATDAAPLKAIADFLHGAAVEHAEGPPASHPSSPRDSARGSPEPATRQPLASPSPLLPPEVREVLAALDEHLIEVLATGAIRLLRVEWVQQQPDDFKMPRRQELEALEQSGASPSPLLTPQEAVALIRRGDRCVGVLTYGWLSPGDPDPAGSRIVVLRRALTGLAIEALFWDFASLFQSPRTPDQEAAFKLALEAMNQLYASILATTVLQIQEIPTRPPEFDGALCLFKISSTADEHAVRTALSKFGTIESCDLSCNPAIVRFASHASAIAAKEAGAPPGLCEGLDTLYNETPYMRRGW